MVLHLLVIAYFICHKTLVFKLVLGVEIFFLSFFFLSIVTKMIFLLKNETKKKE